MDFDSAIEAHNGWKQKLNTYVRNPDGSLKAAEVQCDDRCELGKWIHGDGAKFNTLAEYVTLRQEHARFHKAAAAVIEKADAGKSVSADMMAGGMSDFSNSSMRVISSIRAMQHSAR